MTKKLMLRKELIDLNGLRLEDIACDFQGFSEKAPKAYLEYDYYSSDGEFNIYIVYEELETDKEYTTRVAKEMKLNEAKKLLKEKKKDRELKEYKRLKKKYEGTDSDK